MTYKGAIKPLLLIFVATAVLSLVFQEVRQRRGPANSAGAVAEAASAQPAGQGREAGPRDHWRGVRGSRDLLLLDSYLSGVPVGAAMICFECYRRGQHNEAVGICHHCSVAVCADHGSVIDRPVHMQLPLVKIVSLPKSAQELLCNVCRAALEQPRTGTLRAAAMEGDLHG